MTTSAPAAPRNLRTACVDAVPDVFAAAACALAWKQPDALGFDLLQTTGLLYFIELPLAILIGFAGVRRVRDGRLTRDEKRWFVLLPTALLCIASAAMLGVSGLLAVAWLGARSIARVTSDVPDMSPGVSRLWLVLGRKGASISFELTTQRPAKPEPGVVVVPAGHEQLMAAATIATWLVIPVAIAILPSFGLGGASADYAASVGWDDTFVGTLVPAHLALAAGLILFSVRTLGHFEGLDEPPPARIEEDALLREVIEKVEGRKVSRHTRRKQ